MNSFNSIQEHTYLIFKSKVIQNKQLISIMFTNIYLQI